MSEGTFIPAGFPVEVLRIWFYEGGPITCREWVVGWSIWDDDAHRFEHADPVLMSEVASNESIYLVMPDGTFMCPHEGSHFDTVAEAIQDHVERFKIEVGS